MFKCPVCKMEAKKPEGIKSGVDYLLSHLYIYHPTGQESPAAIRYGNAQRKAIREQTMGMLKGGRRRKRTVISKGVKKESGQTEV